MAVGQYAREGGRAVVAAEADDEEAEAAVRFGGVIGVGQQCWFGWARAGGSCGCGCGEIVVGAGAGAGARRTGSSSTGGSIGVVAAPRAAAAAEIGQIGPNFRTEHSATTAITSTGTSSVSVRWRGGGEHVVVVAAAGGHGEKRPQADRHLAALRFITSCLPGFKR